MAVAVIDTVAVAVAVRARARTCTATGHVDHVDGHDHVYDHGLVPTT
jgi:hypothetical protein